MGFSVDPAEPAVARAFIDPLLAIDSQWLVARIGTSLTLPEGVGNAMAPVPEPGSWALMLGGMAILAVCQRLRLRQVH